MNRRTSRTARQVRRSRREPLLMIVDDRPGMAEWVGSIARLGYRYRSELVPLFVAAALAVVAAMLHGNHVSPWSVELVALPSQAPSAGRGSRVRYGRQSASTLPPSSPSVGDG